MAVGKGAELTKEELTPIQQFYYGRSVFITGVSGFVGKVLLEKLLRCCPGIGTVYILMRPKKGLTSSERIENMFNVELFDKLKECVPNYRDKVVIVEGDLEKPSLGLSEIDLEKLKQNVSVAFLSAARVRFDDPVRVAVQNNLIAVSTLLDLLREFPHIVSVVHVSTSYIHRDPDLTVPEYVPKANVTPKQILDALEWMDDDALTAITPMLLQEKPSTYLFSKHLAEIMVVDKRGDLPVSIVRPCNIAPTLKDPFPGWCDTIQGMQGLMLAAAKGFLRTLWTVRGLKINVIPVDAVVNSLIATAWYSATGKANKMDDIFVVNCVIDHEKLPCADETLLNQALKRRSQFPLVNFYRYPDFTVHYSRFAYTVHAFFDHYIPAVIGDTFLFIFTGKTLMMRLYRRINFLYGIFLKVGTTPWIAKTKNLHAIDDSMTEKDKEIFYVDVSDLDWIKWMDDCFMGGRKFIAKEDPSNIPYARRKAQIWWFVTTLLKWLLILYVIYYFFPRSYVSNYFTSYYERKPLSITE